MDADLLIGMFAMSAAANMFTLLAIGGFALFLREERTAKEQGRKLSVPGYVWLAMAMPAALAIASLWYVSSSA